ncbi:MAG: hypothetical protein LBE76_08965 [Nitrososphaerota archaeon]|jgi:NADH:ubiquinone oxidoreductase subunit 6 (subunit J)|nr:hypothetical protein [Nitrososphaerota archaeon]
MQRAKVIIGEFIVLIASVLIFRSLWMILDKHFGYDYLELMLTFGIIATILGLIVLNREIKQNKNSF